MRHKEIWLFLFFAGALAFNWPFLAVFRDNLPAYLFASWLLLILVIYMSVRRTARDDDGG